MSLTLTVLRAMIVRLTAYKARLSGFVFFFFVVGIHGSFSLNSEGEALLQFRSKVGFDPYEVLATWNPNDCSPCMWSGVHCQDGKVDTLDLNGHNLEGVLAPELGSLSHLRLLDLSKNHLSGTIPQEFGQLSTLEVLDLSDNLLTGTLPAKLGRLNSLKRLLLCNNGFEGSLLVEIGKLSLHTESQCDIIQTSNVDEVGCVNRKFGHCIWQRTLKQSQKTVHFKVPRTGTIIRYLNPLPYFKFGSALSDDLDDESHDNLTDLLEPGVVLHVDNQLNSVRRILVEQPSNLIAIPPEPARFEIIIELPSRSSGSFLAIPNGKKLSPAPLPSPTSGQKPNKNIDTPNSGGVGHPQPTAGKFGNSLNLVVGLSVAIFLLIVAAALCVVCRSRAAKTIGPWKSGLSGQLQKAFVTGVPKLNRVELETACEDFSNIITTDDGVATMYKGTLSSGVEIAVASTATSSIKDWSKSSELVFRKKVDTLSRVNHENFLNLIGYCEDNKPFTRMMVFEYASNGTLFEHMHVKEVEHIDWNARMRIIMGCAYCLQHMHDLNPPITHPNLTSKEIILTDDYAAKIGDIDFWEELIKKSKKLERNESEDCELPPLADVETNVHSFGILLLEIISGKLPSSEEQMYLVDVAAQYLNDKKMSTSLMDPTLKSFKENELDVVCEVILRCVEEDARSRPSMREVIEALRRAIDISPELATPRLSSLWWAELEILSAEAP